MVVTHESSIDRDAPAARVSVVVLSYNRPGQLRKALRSIVEQSYRPFEILLVDNRSESSAEILRVAAEFPEVQVIANDRNLGFTGGMNLGLLRAKGDYIYLTEDDLLLEDNCIQSFIEYFEATPDAGVASGLMLTYGTDTIHYAGGIVALGGVYSCRIVGGGDVDEGKLTSPYDVSYISGAMMFARASLWRQVVGFRDEFFMYFEDTELCLRLLSERKRITVVPRARASHFVPSGAVEAASLEFHKRKNMAALYCLHASPWVWPEFAFRYLVAPTVSDLFAGRPTLASRLRALLWIATHGPGLLFDRLRRRGKKGKADGTWT